MDDLTTRRASKAHFMSAGNVRATLACALACSGLFGTSGCSDEEKVPGDPFDGGAEAADREASGDDAEADAAVVLEGLKRTRIGSENSHGWDTRGEAFGEFDFRAPPFAEVILRVELQTSCGLERLGGTPRGQRWPATCDAFDRNLDLFIDDTAPRGARTLAAANAVDASDLMDAAEASGAAEARDASASGDEIDATVDEVDASAAPFSKRTPFEVVHAITPFGGPLSLEVDVTDLANAQPGPHRLRVALESYSDPDGLVTGSNAGWTVSAQFRVTRGPAPRRVLAAVPLFTGRVTGPERTAPVAWSVPSGTTSARLEYRTSGHGGAMSTSDPRCNGPAEEFCRRTHLLFVDDVTIADVEPYRRDCGQLCTLIPLGTTGAMHCQENPTGDVRSVRASRANWCPGSMTPPFSWNDLASLAASGEHRFSLQVPGLLAGGMWLASATYYAYGANP
jgi:hypothetical protein